MNVATRTESDGKPKIKKSSPEHKYKENIPIGTPVPVTPMREFTITLERFSLFRVGSPGQKMKAISPMGHKRQEIK